MTDTRTPRILLVEDDPHQQLLFAEELRDEGYDVAIAGSGAAAIEAVKQTPPDLVVLDIAMPGMDGIEAIGRILAENNQIPVILHTAYATYKDNFMTWAAVAYVVRSADLTELKAEIRRVLEKTRQRANG